MTFLCDLTSLGKALATPSTSKNAFPFLSCSYLIRLLPDEHGEKDFLRDPYGKEFDFQSLGA